LKTKGEHSFDAIKGNHALDPEGATHVLLVDHELTSLNLCKASPNCDRRIIRFVWLHTPEALRSDPLWAEVRHRAHEALEGFRDLGLPIPALTDPDFNAPREDAP
jgi:hypothetical protein